VLASDVTKPDGSFTLQNVPAGTAIPLVIQLGRWRRQITVDIQPCTNNVIADGVARFPRNKSEGDIPLTAISTGRIDALECLLRKIGIEDSEFTAPTGNGRIQMFYSNGAKLAGNTATELDLKGTTAGGGLWSKYTQILFPCEGEPPGVNPAYTESAAALGNFRDYVHDALQLRVALHEPTLERHRYVDAQRDAEPQRSPDR
jgi:hypothetical protein